MSDVVAGGIIVSPIFVGVFAWSLRSSAEVLDRTSRSHNSDCIEVRVVGDERDEDEAIGEFGADDSDDESKSTQDVHCDAWTGLGSWNTGEVFGRGV